MDFRTLAPRRLALALLGTSLTFGAAPMPAQDSGKGFELHAKGHSAVHTLRRIP